MTQANLTLKGGAERVVLEIAKHYDAPVYTAEYDREKTFEEFKKLDVRVMGKGALAKMLPYGRVAQGLNYGLSFYNMLIKEDYDVINAHIAPSHWIRNRNERVLWYAHTPLRDFYDLYKYRLSLTKSYQKPVRIIGAKIGKRLDQAVVKDLEMIVTNSNNTRSRITRFYNRDAKVLGGGVDCKQFRNDGDEKYFYYVSRFSPNKRQDYAIDAFRMFKRKQKGYRLILAGAVSKDRMYHDYYLKIREMARETGDVKIVENIDEGLNRELYSRSTAVLFTPVDEDYGLVPLEAMASYKPIISVNEGGPKDVISNGRTGFLVNSAKEMANRMLFVAQNPSAAAKIGKMGRNEVLKNHTWSGFFKVFDRYLREVSKK